MFVCQSDILKVMFERGLSGNPIIGGEKEVRGRDAGRAMEHLLKKLKSESAEPQQWFRECS